MQRRPLRFQKTDVTLSLSDISNFGQGWLLDCQCRMHTPSTIANRKNIVEKLVWFLRNREFAQCGHLELRQFMAHVVNGHNEPDGRWGNPREKSPIRPRTAQTYHSQIKTFFNWIVEEGGIEESPFASCASPIYRSDQIVPFTLEQIQQLLDAAAVSDYPERNAAMLNLMFDTGARSMEIRDIKIEDIDLNMKRVSVMGKGQKTRMLFFGRRTAQALYKHFRTPQMAEYAENRLGYAFMSERGSTIGDPLTKSGMAQLFERLGKTAGIRGVRCSPHTMRHTYAVTFLRNGGNVFSLKELLGHTDIKMTMKYVALAEADIETQSRLYSPVDRMHSARK